MSSRQTLLLAAAPTAGLTLAAVTPALAGASSEPCPRAAAVPSAQGGLQTLKITDLMPAG
ncbi:hypothetical protein ACH5A3_34990 [Streptomyces echinatus]|uniref:hypothetical protein n=1 Tax=Streptomyces echinatus TaxID=67293 RepID=UPI00378C833B